MNYILFDDHNWEQLLPLTFTRPVSYLRTGILTIKEKWEKNLGSEISCLTRDYLSPKYPINIERDNILINSSLLPSPEILAQISQLKTTEAILSGERIIAVRLDKHACKDFDPSVFKALNNVPPPAELRLIDKLWHIFQLNGEEIASDYALLTRGRKSAALSKTLNLIHPENIFAEEGFKAEFATINASTGPVYLGRNSEIMEGSVIRGPFCLGENSVVKLSAKIYGPTTIGPGSKVGGEINNSVIWGNSNKAHDGFLGNSVIGEWCNIGADSNNSNLKNNYASVKLWNYKAEKFVDTGLTFCGLIMGDHSKCGINTMFNTGTVVGVNANIFGSGFPRNFVPSFSWGGAHGLSTFTIPKAFDVAEKVMGRRNIPLSDEDKEILKAIFKLTEKFRS
ncbi:MAG: GlmU family protein [Bacteroidales bacterium]|nr:GlmU family protein [Bacteroidales bacterium]